MAGFISEAQCTGTCGIATLHAYTYDAVNKLLYGCCRICGKCHVETRPRLIDYALTNPDPIKKGRLNILK